MTSLPPFHLTMFEFARGIHSCAQFALSSHQDEPIRHER